MEKKLYRSVTDRMLGGVCGGLGDYLGIDPTFIRIFFFIMFFGGGAGFWIYLLLWLLVPEIDSELTKDFGERMRNIGDDFTKAVSRPHPKSGLIVGGGFILVGIFWLLEQLNLRWLWWWDFDVLWPILLVIAGVVSYIAGLGNGVSEMSEYDTRSKRKERPSFIWPIILIAVGVVFLLTNLGLVQDDFWNTMWRFWPVIFIAIGLDSLFRRNEIAGPVFMVGLGTIILLSSAGLVGWRAWDILWRLWPLLLVAIGLEIIVGRRTLWVSILVVSMLVASLVGVLWVFGRGGQFRAESLKISSISHPLNEIDEADISISPVVGDLAIDGLIDSNALITGKLNGGGSQGVYTDYSVNGNAGVFTIDNHSFITFPGTQTWDWDFGLTDQIPLDLNISMAVGGVNANLANLILHSLEINQAIGEVNLTLADQEDYSAELSQAIGSIIVDVPENSGLRVEISRAISSLNLPSTFDKRGNYYYSANYETADFKINLEINQAIGSIEIR